ncbi:hypothetical protein KAR91_22185 [Candidatus Pacearchaeota archaeon]|nr:hypothetical protein [Candidatus Pacearchaeota archaeon]
MALDETSVAKWASGLLVTSLCAVIGVKKLVEKETESALKDISELKEDLKNHVTKDEHKLICTMNTKNVDTQFIAMRDHIDTRFDALNERLDKR